MAQGRCEILHIMDYIYEGEVNIYQNDLDAFLDVAQKLKIQGLVGSGQDLKEVEIQNYTKGEHSEDMFNDNVNQEQSIQPLKMNPNDRQPSPNKNSFPHNIF